MSYNKADGLPTVPQPPPLLKADSERQQWVKAWIAAIRRLNRKQTN